MKKLSMMFGIVAMTTTLGLAGCKNKRDTEKKDETAGKVTEPPPADPNAKPDPAKVDPSKADPTKADPSKADPTKTEPTKPDDHAAAANLPAECNDYKASVDKLAACDKLPQASRDALKTSFDAQSKAWANIPADEAAKKTMVDSCKTANDAVKTAAAKICGW
ncbi:MAG TPA: hypothetical protein VGO00_13395 [Kofleriaceae bacterium]|jgi:hypothetical protein|nr:hypothetical protein [Kofleriaceae bacterium]